MKACQVVKPHKFIQLEKEAPDLKTGGDERILVQPQWVSMCGSDIPYFTGSKRHVTYPLPPGAPIHECVGCVIESSSSLFQPGQRVIAIPERDEGLAEYFVAQAAKAVQIPSDLDDYGASCLIQPLSTVINAVDRLGKVEGKIIAIVGLGSIGLMFCWLLQKRKAKRIIGIDPSPERCQAAGRFGASEVHAMRSIEVWHAARQDPGSWEAPDICIEAVGHQSDTINDCISLVRQQGSVLAFGVPDQHVYAFEYEAFFRKNAHLIATVTPRWKEYLTKAREVYLADQDELEPLVTHRLPIRDVEKAFTMYEQHADGIIKALIDMSGW